MPISCRWHKSWSRNKAPKNRLAVLREGTLPLPRFGLMTLESWQFQRMISCGNIIQDFNRHSVSDNWPFWCAIWDLQVGSNSSNKWVFDEQYLHGGHHLLHFCFFWICNLKGRALGPVPRHWRCLPLTAWAGFFAEPFCELWARHLALQSILQCGT